MPNHPRIGVVTEPLAGEPLIDVMNWLVKEVPEVTDLEIGTGAYAPTGHCDMQLMLLDAGARRRWLTEIKTRNLRLAALNCWGNPLHPDAAIAAKHDSDLRDTIRLAAELGVDRIVALAGCPAGVPGEATPHWAAGGYLPYLENIHQRQWTDVVGGYWSSVAAFAERSFPDLMICLELHPGSISYNVKTFEELAGFGKAISANIDPSHFFWMGMDANQVVRRLGARCGHAHGKDVAFQADRLALNGLLDNRWPKPPEEMPWNFATVGHGKDAAWWLAFLADLAAAGRVTTIAIEHEDPFVEPHQGIAEAARLLAGSVATLKPAPAPAE